MQFERRPLIKVMHPNAGRERPVPVRGLLNEPTSQGRRKSAATLITDQHIDHPKAVPG